jgi:large subunit ribosomal protein L22
VRLSAHKARLVADLVRGRDVTEALNILRFTPKAAAKVLAKAIASAAANAEETHGLSPSELYVAQITADEGPMLKRGHPGARGRFKPVLKRSAHITVVLAERVRA